MNDFQEAKKTVLNYLDAFDKCDPADLKSVLAQHVTTDYLWHGMHPFHEQSSADSVIEVFWEPFRTSFTSCQRRMDMFFAGANDCDNGKSVWVANVGNFLGLFDQNWLGIPSTGKLAFLRYAEFHRVENGKIAETALFCDILAVMHQAGVYPLPPMTGAPFMYPGPRTHDGLLFDKQSREESKKTAALVNRMIADLNTLNIDNIDDCPPEFLARTWHDDMCWFGPYGVGATYTIKRYQQQHQYPFRKNLTDKVYNGHIARIAEGAYCGFFGWHNLNNRNTGGFLGLTESPVHAPMRVVDIYRRDRDKLAENWVYIDLLHYLNEQGLDVLARSKQINRT